MFNKILVPLDGSELASSILPQVAELAKKFNSELTLIHVYHTGHTGEIPSGGRSFAPAQIKVCEAYLSLIGKELQNQGLQVNWVCVEGVPPREIISYADKNKADLITMATHGRGEVAWLLGSTAEKVITHATVPVMLFRILFKEPPLLKEQLREFI